MPPAIPAATVVIARPAADTSPQYLLVERAKAMAFAGGALVFPGGRIDPGDHALAATLDGVPDDAVARIAAIRETIEEVGLAIGLTSSPDEKTISRIRAALHAGSELGGLLAEAGLGLDLARLTPFARWRPAQNHSRMFDTRFYITALPEGSPEPQVDATENVRLFWSSAQAVLDDADAGRARIIFPTRRNLERLAGYASLSEAVVDAGRYPIRTITPWTEQRADGTYLCIDDDLGYPITAERFHSAIRA